MYVHSAIFQICEACVLQVTNIEFTSKWCHLQNLDKTESPPEDGTTIAHRIWLLYHSFWYGFCPAWQVQTKS